MMRRILPANHSNDIIKRIDALVLKFCDVSVDCDSLSSLHGYMETILDEGYHVCLNVRGAQETYTFVNSDLDNRES
jgi:hypothetical protein